MRTIFVFINDLGKVEGFNQMVPIAGLLFSKTENKVRGRIKL